MYSILRKPSAFVPIVIPLAFFVYLTIYIALFGIVRQADEGTAAHLFQLWLLAEPFMIGYFVYKWFPQKRKETLLIAILQIAFALLPVSVVFYLGL